MTAVLGVFGHPVAHSLSPLMHGAALRSCGIDAAYIACDVSPERLGAALSGACAMGWAGVNLTIPHKRAGLFLAHAATERATRIGAGNTIWFECGRTLIDNTDGEGYLRSLAAETGISPHGMNAGLIGAGGAALAVADALCSEGVAELRVWNRSLSSAVRLVEHVVRTHPHVRASAQSLDHFSGSQLDVLVHATPHGMWRAGADHGDPQIEQGRVPADLSPIVDVSGLPDHCVVSDLIYRPAWTALLVAARKRGLRTHGGLGMLAWQGALAWQSWFGKVGPVSVMRQALAGALERT
ncbi:MAG: shikimate dehydrogenase [Firmicutes bacterium]|nr:shikimate dehydrogenase [Bacillota bacterium]